MSDKTKKTNGSSKWWMIGGAVLLFLLLAYFVTADPGLPVQQADAEVRTIRAFIAEEAKTRLDDEFTIDAPFNGTVERIELDEGDLVEKGQVVAQMDVFSLQQQVESTRALVAQARAQTVGVDSNKPKEEDIASAQLHVQEMTDNLAIAQREHSVARIAEENARREFERAEALLADGLLSESAFDMQEREAQSAEQNLGRARLSEQAAEKALKIAEQNFARVVNSVDDNEYMRAVYEAEIASLEAQLRTLQDELDRAEMKAPIDGVILDKYIEDRRVMPAGSPLLRIGDMSTIEIECDVLSEEVVLVKPGAPVEISGKALRNEIVMGQVERIYPSGFEKISSLGIEQQRVRVIIAFDNSELSLRPGTSVDVRIVTDEQQDALAVPEQATFRIKDEYHVFVVNGGRAELRPVDVGIKNTDWAEIRSGLEPGETVVAETRNDLDDGAKVTLLE